MNLVSVCERGETYLVKAVGQVIRQFRMDVIFSQNTPWRLEHYQHIIGNLSAVDVLLPGEQCLFFATLNNFFAMRLKVSFHQFIEKVSLFTTFRPKKWH